MPLDYIVEASTMQSMGIYTCLKAYVVEEPLELPLPPARKRSQGVGGQQGHGIGRASHTPPLGPSEPPNLLFPRATLDSQGSSAFQGLMESE